LEAIVISFFANVRPFVGEFADIQRVAITSWLETHRSVEVIILGDVEGALDVAMDMGVGWVQGVATNDRGTELVSDIWRQGVAEASNKWICALNSDNVVGADIVAAVEALKEVERPFIVGQRLDVDRDDPENATLHPPCGVDWFLFRAGTVPFEDIPPFAVGRTLYDNWLVWAAINKWGMTVIDATSDVTVIHINHGFPEYGGKQQMIESDEKAENTRIFWDTDAPRPFGINDAPFVLAGGGLKQRE
jgi:hypothetical protein